MREPYKKPVAKHIDYQYQEQVKAQSFNCDSVIFNAQTLPNVPDCKEYRQYTQIVTRSLADPCKQESPFRL